MKIMETIVGLLFWKESERKKTTDEKNRQKKKKLNFGTETEKGFNMFENYT